MSDEIKTALVVADVYKLSRDGKKFDKDIKRAKLKFKNHTIDRAYCEEMNARWGVTGTWCVIDEEASLKNAANIKEKAATRLRNDKARETAGKAVAALALGVNVATPVEDTEPEEVGSMKYSIKQLKDLESLTGMSDSELNEFFETENRAGAKAYLGELIVANNENELN